MGRITLADLAKLRDEDLAGLPWDQLIQMRQQLPDPDAQARLGPYEHRAYAREEVAANPLMAVPYAAMVPGYTLAKLANQAGVPRSQASLGELVQGYAGIKDGLKQWWNRPRSVSGT